MENNQQKKVGAGILTLSIIQLVFSGIGIIGLIASFTMKTQIQAMGVKTISSTTLIITLVVTISAVIGIILILTKKELGIYIYFIAEVAGFMDSIVENGFTPTMLLSLIIPVLMAVFLWKKKEVFTTKAEV